MLSKVIKITKKGKPDNYVYIDQEGIEQFATGHMGTKGARRYTQEDLKNMYDEQEIQYSGILEPESSKGYYVGQGGKQKSRRRFMKIKGSRKYKSK